MRAFEFLLEKESGTLSVPGDPSSDPLYNIKLAIANKIKELPADASSEKALAEIEDLLSSVQAGGKAQFIGGQLQQINDPDVNAAQKLLSKYVLSIDSGTPADKKQMFELWKSKDGLIDIAKLLKPGQHSVAEIVRGYESNPAIKELADDLSGIASLGQGKGEFMLSVFSKRITKADKGDLLIDGFGKVEVKTTDVGAGRFYDQEVRPTTEYQGSVNDFIKQFGATLKENKLMSTTGVSISQLILLKNVLPTEDRGKFKSLITKVMTNLFPGAPEGAEPVVSAIMVDNENLAKQRYAVANLNNYMKLKADDKGILMINLSKNPSTFVFFDDNKSLNAGGLRLHASTAYPVTNDPRNAYPQTSIVPTTQSQE
jgi:hypothetical protein